MIGFRSNICKSAAFDESLVLNVLFSGRTLIDAPFFFNSNFVAAHMDDKPAELSLLEAAVRSGIILPAFPNAQLSSLADYPLFATKLYGKRYEITTGAMRPHVANLIRSADVGAGTIAPFTWSKDISRSLSYENTLTTFLQPDHAPAWADDRNAALWLATERWRTETLAEAARNTRRKGLEGLQRVELYKALGRQFKFHEDQEVITAKELLDSRAVPEEHEHLQAFLRWATLCKFQSDAEVSSTNANFPGFQANQDHFIIQKSEHESVLQNKISMVSIDVLLPPISSLLRFRTADLIKIREERSNGYLEALQEWASDPSLKNESEMEFQLTRYAASIRARYEDVAPQPTKFSFFPGTTGAVLGQIGNIASTILAGTGHGLFATSYRTGLSLITYGVNESLQQGPSYAYRSLEFTSEARQL